MDNKQTNQLTYDEFKVLWKIKAKDLGSKEQVLINSYHWLLYVQNLLSTSS